MTGKKRMSLRMKLILPVTFVLIATIIVNLLIFNRINQATDSLEAVYDTNIRLGEMESLVRSMENDIFQYLNIQDMDAHQSFLSERESFAEMILEIDTTISDQPGRTLERSIRELGVSYLQLTERAINERQSGNSAGYRETYAEIQSVSYYLLENISGLDTLRFRTNSENYDTLYEYLRYLEVYMTFALVAVVLNLMVILWLIIGNITQPLEKLAGRAGEIGEGNFDLDPLPITSKDEIGTVTEAFNSMVVSINDSIQKIRNAMAVENEMRERELTMQNLLKDAQLKYFQAQINPHFLFNTLNAGQQLAMMEDADRTYSFMENLSRFFRFRLRKNGEESTIRDEIGLIDSYLYIMNVRFSGEIQMIKEIDETLLDCLFPGMVLQPIVENALTHGLAGVEWEKCVWLNVFRQDEKLVIEIRDNGVGMSRELVNLINNAEYKPSGDGAGNGIGMVNVRERLRLYYHTDDVLTVRSEGDGKGTDIRICVPLRREENV